MPPVPSIWIPGRRRAPARIIQRAGPPQTAVPGNATADPAARPRPLGRSRMRLPGTYASLVPVLR
jgi:hypothetical protein